MSDKMINLGNFEMLKALYDFKATYAKTLSFRENDHFILHQTSTKQRNWWQVINDKGQMGFVPSNYVANVQVSPHFLIQYLCNCIDTLRSESSRTGIPSDKHELILRLTEKKRQAEISLHNKGKAPQPPDFSSGSSAGGDIPSYVSSEPDIRPIRSPILEKSAECSSSKSFNQVATDSSSSSNDLSRKTDMHQSKKSSHEDVSKSQSIDTTTDSKYPSEPKTSTASYSSKKESSSSDISAKPIYELVETVRKNTQLSHEMSRVAVATVIQGLEELLPTQFQPYLSRILSYVEGPLKAPEPFLDQTHDATRLKVIFTELTSCKEDSQQRSWMLHEDEQIIKEYILELISILSNADATVSRHVISTDQYDGVIALIQYYQMEVRWSIRQLLLQSFGVMCSLDATVVHIMLNSVLPMELARDMLSNPKNIPRLNYSSLLLTMIFSMGEPMPITHLEHLGTEFLIFLFRLIEYPPETDLNEQIPDLFLNLILAFNLQYSLSDENVVIEAAANAGEAKILTEKILLLLNREEDPVRIFDHQPAPPHSVIKLFIDLFNNMETASLFYTNDTKVLIDIIVRQLSDISAGDLRRQQYLLLCQRVMRNTNYGDHFHRKDDILKCFTRIFCEETEISYADQKLVRVIMNEFPQYFQT